MFRCKCGGKHFTVDYQEIVIGTASVDDQCDILETRHEQGINHEFTSNFICDGCGREYTDLSPGGVTIYQPFSQTPEEQQLSEKTKRYLRTGGVRCLICESEDIEGSSVDINGNGASQRCHCNECDASWHDMYKLDDVQLEGEYELDGVELGNEEGLNG